LHPVAAIALALGLGVQTARLLAPRVAGFDRAVRLTLPLMILLVAVLAGVLLSSARRQERSAVSRLTTPPSGARNLVLIGWDAVRRASLSLYGYPRPTTPALERWGGKGTVFEHAFATTAWTLPSHASMFTGRLPFDMSVGWLSSLDDRWPTLAGFLQSQG